MDATDAGNIARLINHSVSFVKICAIFSNLQSYSRLNKFNALYDVTCDFLP